MYSSFMCYLTFFFFIFFFFFFNDTATTEIYTLSLHDALPIWMRRSGLICLARSSRTGLDMSHILHLGNLFLDRKSGFSRNAETDLVCRLLLEKKKKRIKQKLTFYYKQADLV